MDCSKRKIIRTTCKIMSAIMIFLAFVTVIIGIVKGQDLFNDSLMFFLLGEGLDNIIEIADNKEKIKELERKLDEKEKQHNN